MKTSFFFTLLYAGIVLTACSNDDGGNTPQIVDNGKMANLVIDLSSTKTRAIDDPYTNSTKETFTALQIVIAKSDGTILKSYTESMAETNKFEKIYGKVSATAAKVYVIANYGTPGAITEGITTIDDLKASMFYAATSQQTKGGIIMDGEANIVRTKIAVIGSDTKDDKYDASLDTYATEAVTLIPAVSRMQIKKVSAKTDSKVTNYKVTGIYLNKVYQNITLNFTGSNLVIGGEEDEYYNITPTDNFGIFADRADNGITIPNEKCIAFNYFAAASTVSAPHIIVKLEDITYSNGYTGLENGWLTIQSFNNKEGGTANVLTEKGKIYTIDDISFGESNIGPHPYQSEINVKPTITVKAWEEVNIIPNLD